MLVGLFIISGLGRFIFHQYFVSKKEKPGALEGRDAVIPRQEMDSKHVWVNYVVVINYSLRVLPFIFSCHL
jgi:hypothetical protein